MKSLRKSANDDRCESRRDFELQLLIPESAIDSRLFRSCEPSDGVLRPQGKLLHEIKIKYYIISIAKNRQYFKRVITHRAALGSRIRENTFSVHYFFENLHFVYADEQNISRKSFLQTNLVSKDALYRRISKGRIWSGFVPFDSSSFIFVTKDPQIYINIIHG